MFSHFFMKNITKKFREEYLNCSPDDFVKVHTIQNLVAWETIDENGYIAPPRHMIESDDITCNDYVWMCSKMQDRVENYSGDYPVWARFKKLNMKSRLNWSQSRGQKYVYVSALVPKKRMLASLFTMFESKMMNCPCSIDELSDETWDAMSQKDIEDTWNLMFDISNTESKFYGYLGDIQLCIDRLYKSEIYKVRMIKNTNHKTSEILYFDPKPLLYKKIIGAK